MKRAITIIWECEACGMCVRIQGIDRSTSSDELLFDLSFCKQDHTVAILRTVADIIRHEAERFEGEDCETWKERGVGT